MKLNNFINLHFRPKTNCWIGVFSSLLLILIIGCSGSTPEKTIPSVVDSSIIAQNLGIQTTPLASSTSAAQAIPTGEVAEAQKQTPTPAPTNPIEAIKTQNPQTIDVTSTVTAEISVKLTPTEVVSQKTERNCTDVAAFMEDVTIPDGTLFKGGVEFVKTWRVRNEGTCVWADYQVVYAGGEPMNGISTPLQTVNPKEYANISVKLYAPIRGGRQVGNWLFLNSEGKPFGVGVPNTGALWVDITVDYPIVSNPPSSSGSGSPNSGGSGVVTTSPPTCDYSQNSEYISKIYALVNAARVEQGLLPLEIDTQLAQAAQIHSVDMACNGLISHNGSDGLLWYDRVKAQGFANYTTARENIYAGNPDFGGDADGTFKWWMNSPIHRANILFENVTHIGIGYAFYNQGDVHGYFTLVVARP